jgi:hypothetical protein
MSNRALDALFAERVLGCKLIKYLGDYSCASCGHNVLGGPDADALLYFTSSLDAAWAGVEKVRNRGLFADRSFILCVPVEGRPEAKFIFARDAESVRASAPTPALALVKACLLAVGVTQAEIDDATA